MTEGRDKGAEQIPSSIGDSGHFRAQGQNNSGRELQSGDLLPADTIARLRTRADADPVFTRILNEVVRNAGSAPWREIRDGVSIRPIWDDRTFLLRCAAGKQIPTHIHDREEWLCVLDGEMRIGESHLTTGDIEISPVGSEHPTAEALEDCLVLLQHSR